MKPNDCAAILKNHDKILIITHRRPDGDTLGSGAALCRALRSMGKTAFMYNNPDITDNYRVYVDEYLIKEDFTPDFTVAVDMASRELMPTGLSHDFPVDLCIDHHPSNTDYAKATYLEEGFASCGEAVFLVINALGAAIDTETANLLYIAVSTDTGCFAYGNTNAHTLHTAARLVELGAENAELNKKIFRSSSYARLMLEGRIFSGLTVHFDGKVSIATISQATMKELGVTENDLDDIASLPGRVAGTIASITIREREEGGCKVSYRSSGLIDANEICSKFGGGGHMRAAGCAIDLELHQAKEAILKATENALR